MVRRVFRFALRFAVPGFCLLSLLACLGAGVLWWRSYAGNGDRLNRGMAGGPSARYTLRSERGRVVRYEPPPPPAGPETETRALAAEVRNDDVRWLVETINRDGGRLETRVSLLGFGTRMRLFYEPGVAADARRLLLDALDDPERFVAAHVALSLGIDRATSGPAQPGGRGLLATYNGLRVELEPEPYVEPPEPSPALEPSPEPSPTPEPSPRPAVGFSVEQDVRAAWIDPAQLSAIRDYWHDKLDVPVWSVPYWPLVTATAVPPLLWLGSRTRRVLILRRRRRLGLCPNCGYDLRGSRGAGRCSECGEAVPAGAKGATA